MKLTAKQFINSIINDTLEELKILDLFYEDELLAFIRENYTPDQIYNDKILKECVEKK
jgi:hypothetical protein